MKFCKWLIPLIVFVMLWPAGTQVQAKSPNDIKIYLDGYELASDVSPYIVPKLNVTMVPLRVISEDLWARVQWSQATKTVTITNDGDVIVLKIGSTTAQVNGNPMKLEAAAQAVQGRTMVPLRFVSEQLGLKVVWNQSLKTITLTSSNASIPEIPSIPTVPTVPTVPSIPDKGNGQSTSLKGAWVSTIYNLDWPSKSSYGKIAQQKTEFTTMLDSLQTMGLNAVFVQVRPTADALYSSKLVPWSAYLTGTAGKDPGYDPLQFMIEETHRRGMEFHAWFNPFRASTTADTSKLPSNHVAIQHPDWIVNYSNVLYINPGVPEARQHIVDVVMEVVKNYDVDGIHLDDYFYPSGETPSNKFADDFTFQTYNLFGIKNKGDWRRDNINQFVKSLGESIAKVKPSVSYGISPFGVWRNIATDLTGSNTKAGVTAYDSMYADVRTWIQNEWIDYVAPQVYWSQSFTNANYNVLIDWWANEVKNTSVRLYIGHAAYKLGTTEAGWQSASEIINQLKYNANNREVDGSIFFSARYLQGNTLGISPLLKSYFRP